MLEANTLSKDHIIIQTIIQGIKETIYQNEVNVNLYNTKSIFKSLENIKFSEIRTNFGIDNDLILDNFKKNSYIIKNKMYKKKNRRIIFYSENFSFVCKEIRECEKNFLLKILDSYIVYLNENCDTLLSKIFGCYSLKMKNKKTKYMLIMNNVFPREDILNEVYDLKGSEFGRITNNSNETLKDIDWYSREIRLRLFGKKKLLINQIEKDCEFLMRNQIMDYSIIIGIKRADDKPKINMYQRIDSNNTKIDYKIDDYDLFITNRINSSIFTREFGGYSSDIIEYPQLKHNSEVYFIGIIDILTFWSFKKRLELFINTFCCRYNFSCIDPEEYRKRFLEMIKKEIFIEL